MNAGPPAPPAALRAPRRSCYHRASRAGRGRRPPVAPSRTHCVTAEIVLQGLASGLLMGLVYALIAAGLSLIFGLMEIVNFAHGEFLMVAMYGAFWAWALAGLDPLVSLPLVTGGLALLGVLVYRGVIRRILGAPMLAQVFATFGLAVFLRSAAQFLWTPDFRLVRDPWVGGRVDLLGLYLGRPQLVAAGARG